MSERIVPCILDPNRVCPETCKLHLEAKNVFQKIAKEFGVDIEEEQIILRTGTLEQISQFRSENAQVLKEAGLIQDCHHYPEADITQPSKN